MKQRISSAEAQLLLTGFAPFASFAINPSWESAKAAAERFGPRVANALLPVDYEAARRELYALLEQYRPAACLCMGLTPRPEFCLDQVARKPAEFAYLDGEASMQGHWPWPSVEKALARSGVAWRRSNDAGAYVCESTYWSLLDFRARHGYPRQAGFLHVPCESEAYPVARTIACVAEIVNDWLAAN